MFISSGDFSPLFLVFYGVCVMKRLRIIQRIALVLIMLGLLGLAPSVYIRHTLSRSNVAQAVPSQRPPKILFQAATLSGKPVRLQVPSVGLDVVVLDGDYDFQKQVWNLTEDKAHFATISDIPNNEAGNTYIYGHNRKEVLAPLFAMTWNAVAYLYTENGHKFTYAYTDSKAVKPTDTSIFSYQGPPVLTAQTCSGTFAQNRQQFTFSLIGVEKQ